MKYNSLIVNKALLLKTTAMEDDDTLHNGNTLKVHQDTLVKILLQHC